MFLAITLLIVVIFLLLAILLLLLKLRDQLKKAASGTGGGTSGSGGAGGTGGTGGTGGSGGTGATTIPDQIAGTSLASYLLPRFAGTPADGSAAVPITQNTVVWVDHGDEVLVHLDSLTTQIVNQAVLVSIDLECDQTGRTPLVVAFSLGTDAQGGLIASTDEFPRGNGVLAARWGSAVQTAAWSALLSLATDHASERAMSPIALVIQNEQLQLGVGPALKIA
jgi:hypothetical protein